MKRITLAAITERLDERGIPWSRTGPDAAQIDDVFHDHRAVRPGGLFCCIAGGHFDGHDWAAAAIGAGAVALVCQRPLGLGVPEIIVEDVRVAMGPIAALVHVDPSDDLCCVGITGTNGKTTTAALLAGILTQAGRATEVIGTLTGERTTPEATDLQRELAAMRDRGVEAVVMEVSSHALVQHRVDGIVFDMAIFTNLSRDHLDFHGTMEEYFRAKAVLFEPEHAAAAVVNVDDAHGRLLRDAATVPTTGFQIADGEPITALAPVEFTWHGQPVRLALSGRFNVSNALAAATAARGLGVSDAVIRAGLAAGHGVPGRFEMIDAGQDFEVIVDFAHTPDGLSKVLTTANELAASHRLMIVFGAGGDRDRTKRPLMGAAAGVADQIYLTNDNPRSEIPEVIVDEILAGIGDHSKVVVELDRRRAITAAILEAETGDVVVIAGKGHETTQTIGQDVSHFDDREVAREVLRERGFHP